MQDGPRILSNKKDERTDERPASKKTKRFLAGYKVTMLQAAQTLLQAFFFIVLLF